MREARSISEFPLPGGRLSVTALQQRWTGTRQPDDEGKAVQRTRASSSRFLIAAIAPDSMTADALATGLSVMGIEKGLKLAESLDGVAALMVTGEDGELGLHPSAGFAR